MERTKPTGRVVGIDLIPASPPRGVATFQGDFLSPSVQKLVRDYIEESHRLHVSHTPTTAKRDEPEAPTEQTGQSSSIEKERPTIDGPSIDPNQTGARLVDVCFCNPSPSFKFIATKHDQKKGT